MDIVSPWSRFFSFRSAGLAGAVGCHGKAPVGEQCTRKVGRHDAGAVFLRDAIERAQRHEGRIAVAVERALRRHGDERIALGDGAAQDPARQGDGGGERKRRHPPEARAMRSGACLAELLHERGFHRAGGVQLADPGAKRIELQVEQRFLPGIEDGRFGIHETASFAPA